MQDALYNMMRSDLALAMGAARLEGRDAMIDLICRVTGQDRVMVEYRLQTITNEAVIEALKA